MSSNLQYSFETWVTEAANRCNGNSVLWVYQIYKTFKYREFDPYLAQYVHFLMRMLSKFIFGFTGVRTQDFSRVRRA